MQSELQGFFSPRVFVFLNILLLNYKRTTKVVVSVKLADQEGAVCTFCFHYFLTQAKNTET